MTSVVSVGALPKLGRFWVMGKNSSPPHAASKGLPSNSIGCGRRDILTDSPGAAKRVNPVIRNARHSRKDFLIAEIFLYGKSTKAIQVLQI
jgi:hypothetical protein